MQMGSANRSYPIDNVQRLERVREDGEFLQMMADFEEPAEAMNEITNELVPIELFGLPVVVRGGRVEVPAIEGDIATMVMTPNDDEVVGFYHGADWRKAESLIDPSKAAWFLCHKVFTGTSEFTSDEGDRVHIDHYTRVSVTGADVIINSAVDSHDYRQLHEDGFTLKVDQIAMDESLSAHERIAMLARMVGTVSTSIASPAKDLLRHRLSYINHLGLVDDYVCITPFAYWRDDESTKVISTADRRLIGPVRMVGMDLQYDLSEDGIVELDDSEQVLSLEIELDGYGLCSVPYKEDYVQVLQLISK